MSFLLVLILLFTLLAVEVVYFKLADGFDIIDQPNERSSHTSVTLRGGGIIFPVAAILFYISFGFQYTWFIFGLTAIATISFLDDLHTLNNKVRIVIHLLAVSLLLYQWDLFSVSWYWVVLVTVAVIGTINAWNFMDGINGITGAYSLLVVASQYYINEYVIVFTSPELLLVIAMALLVFNFFNFRKKAKCFAGDVGSVSIAFIIIFLLGQLILATENLLYILLLFIYGLDAVSTIVFRVIRKENIFKAHRSHFYQYLANEKRWPHLWVSGLYAVVQGVINIGLIVYVREYGKASGYGIGTVLLICVLGGVLFVLVRWVVEGKRRLLGRE